jgi:DNA-binding NarL/FixJ family response regulator
MGRSTHRPAAWGADAEGMLDIAIVMRHPAMRSSLWAVAQGDENLRPVGAASRLEEAVRLLIGTAPDVVLVDEDCLDRLPVLRAAAPGAAFLVLGMGDHPAYDAHAREEGAAGYVRLDRAAEALPRAIRAATTSSSVQATAA